MPTPSHYVPGVCNIGPAEISKRKRLGFMALIITAVLWALFAYFNLASGWFLILFLPASMSATGFIQGFGHFCAGFGMKGIFNFGSEAGKTDSVSQAEYRAKDKKRASEIFAYSVIIGIAVALIAFFFK